jgi:hypothetical protein
MRELDQSALSKSMQVYMETAGRFMSGPQRLEAAIRAYLDHLSPEPARPAEPSFDTRLPTRFSACPKCGNKRCPHNENDAFQCTGSNEPGQVGVVAPEPPSEGWIPWGGGECPVADDEQVDVKGSDGSRFTNCPARLFRWSYREGEQNLISYRLSAPEANP